MRKSRKPYVKNDLLLANGAESSAVEAVRVGSPAWYHWLAQHAGFVFEGVAGHFTARRELRRGISYWYAYRRRGGKLSKTYLGKAADLTPERLEQAGAALAGQTTLAQLSSKSNPADLIAALNNTPASRSNAAEESWGDRPFLPPAKVRPPALPQRLVARPRLVQRIDTPVTFICAPSGFGKSTLLNQWQEICQMPVAWVSLDANDNSPALFWLIVVTALQTIDSRVGQTLIPYLRGTSQVALADIVRLLASDIRHLADVTGHAQPVGLILDDFHHIQSPEIHATLQAFLAHLPANMRVVIATHTRPPLEVDRLRATARLSELSTDDLRFTVEEGIDFLSRYADERPLAYSDMQSLVKRTEGWATGLMLATLALNRDGARSPFPETFTGAHTYLREYFLQSVLYRQPSAVQMFLLKTAILRQLTGGLCDAVTGQDDGDAMLARLWQENLFVTKLENEGWYRYHDLFAEMLCSELELQYPGDVRHLHRQAAEWYRAQHAPADAVYHLLAIEAWTEAAALIESVALNELEHFGEDSRLLRWLRQLPETVVQQHKTLLFVYIRLTRVAMSQAEVERYLTRIEANILRKPLTERLTDEQDVLTEIRRIRHHWATGDPSVSALSTSETHEEMWQMLNGIIEYQSYWRRDLHKAATLEREVYETAKKRGNLFVILMSGGGHARRLLLQGYLRRSEKLAYEVLQRAYALRGKLPEPASIALGALGQICYERNQLEEAHQLLLRAAEVDPNPTSSNMPINLAIRRALIQSVQGEHEAALATIQAARELNVKRPSRFWLDHDLIAYQALICLRQGESASAKRLLDAAKIPETHPLSTFVRAEILFRQGVMAGSELLLNRLMAQYPYGVFCEPLMGPRVLLALALFEQGKINQARRMMATAVRLAGPEAHIRPFLDYGASSLMPLSLVLDTEKLTPGTRAFARQVLKSLKPAAGGEESAHRADMRPLSTAASISVREQEVLRLVSAGLSNRDIAAELSIAESTVKTHLRNIYSKLNVDNRTQAVAHAQALRLVYVD